MTMKIQKIGVVGAGTMGSGIAQAFAVSGFDVVVRDIAQGALDHAKSAVRRSLDRLVSKNKLEAAAAEAALARIRMTLAIEDFADCDLVVEAIVEKFEVKKAIFAELDRVCRQDAILASNTSSISLTKIAAATKIPPRVIGMHFFNPVPMMPLVEIIRALQTSDEVAAAVTALCGAIGKDARVARDSYGFVVNRVLIPMINEAINCVYENIASAEDVDAMMKLGAAHPMGPLSLGDLIGLDIVLDVMETLYAGFNDPKFRPSPLLKQMCDAGYLGRKTGRGFFTYSAA
ncbi:3-hydroxybutyryl-CoA dehydrogenase [Rhodoblastus acidophilus]|uniref:3-hydroxybutyryl-CoA dehydrogenase n=1 Tax=Candidatus Rhodoblastus alkanivorans TaxID=2954117 RepID=A0ABS9Z6F9_9HYPH|nr:3-hydroxybutyryl-CoA dehydrogenase [Candidatus Rhodoblastus alkanivorans]MCI4678621.1 3-hydroxybutyryl-CoA dehydrogenase [Candidatus Rhodoblastus alkanivorans]MCI4683031.1 3-hydroxybutyryl-CoA dehydrogenase [Candidatus Rhodoblastus alkanivorans]MDI4640341.1 3-hydroxybutyryl-CoA dehydrogenase [Rhodoblastus acidophilus]